MEYIRYMGVDWANGKDWSVKSGWTLTIQWSRNGYVLYLYGPMRKYILN